ncbi:MAG: phosphoribosylamine--glycine ligase [Armatimonadota bacterium]
MGDKLNVLVVGGGGREHALAWKLAQSSRISKLYCAPGNPGIEAVAECVPIPASNIEALAVFARQHQIDLAVIGPESPLIAGIADRLRADGTAVFGPGKRGAVIEGSKSFAKHLMQKHGVPTAAFHVFDNPDDAAKYLKAHPGPVVVKADGEAAGKGAIVCGDEEQAMSAVHAIMVDRVFGSAGDRVVIEERMYGEEFSALAFVDCRPGRDPIFTMMPPSQDHKPVFDGDRGPNTGGMGAYSPVPSVTEQVQRSVAQLVFTPILTAMQDEGIEYRGVLYAGMMLTTSGIRVVEFNCRFGDPETQAILPLMDGDLLDPIEAVAADCGTSLDSLNLNWKPNACVCVVMASSGYPGPYEKGREITGLDVAAQMPNVAVFHAGTGKTQDGRIVTAGGRVLGVTAWDTAIPGAVRRAYQAVQQIRFDGAHYRTDIGRRALNQPCASPGEADAT